MAIDSKRAVPILDIQGGVRCENVGFDMGEADRLGTLPVVLCSVRMTSKGIRGFVRVCSQKGVQVRPAGQGDILVAVPTVEAVKAAGLMFGSEVFECVGKLDDLEYLVGHPSVAAWGYVDRTAKRVGFSCAGAGPEKVRAIKKFADPKACVWTEAHNAMVQAVKEGEAELAETLQEAVAENNVG